MDSEGILGLAQYEIINIDGEAEGCRVRVRVS
jgi:hypothetical protein